MKQDKTADKPSLANVQVSSINLVEYNQPPFPHHDSSQLNGNF